MNDFLGTGTSSDKLKIAQIIPIYKKGGQTLTFDYIPIPKYLMYQHLYDISQFAFRNSYLAEHALISLSEKIRKLDSDNFSCNIFIIKAFDPVEH